MATPQIQKEKKKKLKVYLDYAPDPWPKQATTPSTPTDSRPATPTSATETEPAQRSVHEMTFEDYKAANLDIQQQHDLIGQIRNEIPLIERDEIDGWLLSQAAKQLEISIFPMLKMMHIDPKAVKRMLDEQFRNAYGLEVVAAIAEDETSDVARGIYSEADVGVNDTSTTGPSVSDNNRGKAKATTPSTEITPVKEPAKKKAKRASLSVVQKEVKEYQAKKQRGRKKCLIVTFGSHAAAEKWAEKCEA